MNKKEALEKIKELQEFVEQCEQCEQKPEVTVARGQLWKHDSGHVGIVSQPPSGVLGPDNFTLVMLESEFNDPGNVWCMGKGFSGQKEAFTYIGEAEDLLKIEEKK